MKGLMPYYLSRAALSLGLGALLLITGSAWWMALLITALLLGLFMYAPHSGRYTVHPERGVFAMGRDEPGQGINALAGRNAFIAMTLAAGAIGVVYGMISPGAVPLALIQLLLALGALVYFVSDLALRRA